jgi:hypothetical protein
LNTTFTRVQVSGYGGVLDDPGLRRSWNEMYGAWFTEQVFSRQGEVPVERTVVLEQVIVPPGRFLRRHFQDDGLVGLHLIGFRRLHYSHAKLSQATPRQPVDKFEEGRPANRFCSSR